MSEKFFDVDSRLVESAGDLAIRRVQEVPKEHLEMLGDIRDQHETGRLGEMHLVASVPVALVESWLRDGFDVFKETPAAVVARLRAENLDAFITTNRKV